MQINIYKLTSWIGNEQDSEQESKDSNNLSNEDLSPKKIGSCDLIET